MEKIRDFFKYIIYESPLTSFLGGVFLAQVLIQMLNERYIVSVICGVFSIMFFVLTYKRLKRQHLKIDAIFDSILSRKIEKNVNEK